MPIIVTQNMKKQEMYNMMEFTLDDIRMDENDILEFMVNNVTFTKKEFRENFLPNFCNTVYKYQGGKINEHYIFGILTEWMSKRCIQVYLELQNCNIYISIINKNVNIIENVNKLK